MVICVKCGKEQSRRSQSACTNKGIEGVLMDNVWVEPLKGHAWMDRDEFIAELREKLPPFIRDRIAGRRKQYAEKQAEFSGRLALYSKRLDELQAAYTVYLNEGLPRVVKKKKQRAMRSFLVDMIGYIIGCIIVVLISLKWILPKFDFETTEITFIILGITGGGIFFLGKRVKELLRANRYTESKNFADELAYEWRDNNGIDEAESKVKAEKDKWNDWNERLKRVVHDAECALVGSEELLHYYYHDNQAKNWYVSKIYDGEW